MIEERKGLLKRDIENLENDKTDLEAELEDREQKEKDWLLPEIDKTSKYLEQLDKEIKENDLLIEKK